MTSESRLEVDRRILLFDFDGTIVVTEVLARQAIESFFAEQKIGVPETFPQMIIGKTWKSAVRQMVEEGRRLGLALPDEELLRQEFQSRYRARFAEGVPLVPGFMDRFPELKARAGFVGIVTGSERHEVEAILASWGLSDAFERIWAAGEYSGSKPDPAPYLQAMEDLGVERDQVIVFEDSLAGMESAHRAGVGFVQISHESHSPPSDPRALMTIRDWFELTL
jgi:HAD superfamily hydrolase (TIGR01509 family)